MKNGQRFIEERMLNVGGHQNVPRMHVSLGHFIEHSSGVFEMVAFGVHQQEIGLESDAGEDSKDHDLGMNLLSRINCRKRGTVS